MASQAFHEWEAAGRPDSGLALPLTQLADTLTAEGWLVYRWPDDSHLQADVPEDHTQFSATGYPEPSPRWWRHAIDVMPDGKGPEALFDLGERITLDRISGRILWLKYINRPDVRGQLDTARQDNFKNGAHNVYSSSDVGHLHLSSTTGVETLSDPYNPLAPAGAALTSGVDMLMVRPVGNPNQMTPPVDGAVYLWNGERILHITPAQFNALKGQVPYLDGTINWTDFMGLVNGLAEPAVSISGGSIPADLQPVLDAIAGVPAATGNFWASHLKS